MKLKDWFEASVKLSPGETFTTAEQLFKLQAIENWFNLMWGIELDIEVKPCEPQGNRFYSKSIAKLISKK